MALLFVPIITTASFGEIPSNSPLEPPQNILCLVAVIAEVHCPPTGIVLVPQRAPILLPALCDRISDKQRST